MDLALLVYGISLLHNTQALVVMVAVVAAIVAVVAVMYRYLELSISKYDGQGEREYKREQQVAVMSTFWKAATVCVCLSVTAVAIPSERTAYTMLAAYAAQKVAENPRSQEIADKILTVANAKLDRYVEEMVEDVKPKKK